MPRKQASKTAAVKSATKPVAAKTRPAGKPVAVAPAAAPVAVKAIAAKAKLPATPVVANAAAKQPIPCKKAKVACAPVAARPMTPARTPVSADKTPRLNTRPVQDRAVAHAIALLVGAGCKYDVVDSKGKRYTSPGMRVNSFVALNYNARVSALKVGERIVFDLHMYSRSAQNNFQAAVCGLGGRKFGRGNLVTSRNGDTCEVMRLG